MSILKVEVIYLLGILKSIIFDNLSYIWRLTSESGKRFEKKIGFIDKAGFFQDQTFLAQTLKENKNILTMEYLAKIFVQTITLYPRLHDSIYLRNRLTWQSLNS